MESTGLNWTDGQKVALTLFLGISFTEGPSGLPYNNSIGDGDFAFSVEEGTAFVSHVHYQTRCENKDSVRARVGGHFAQANQFSFADRTELPRPPGMSASHCYFRETLLHNDPYEGSNYHRQQEEGCWTPDHNPDPWANGNPRCIYTYLDRSGGAIHRARTRVTVTPPGSGGGGPPPGGGGPPPGGGGPPPGGGGPPPGGGGGDDDGDGDDEPPPSGPPEARITHDAECADGLCRARTGVRVSFRDESAGAVRTRSWEFGDGRRSRDGTPNHAWREPGFYEVTLTVGDGTTVSTDSLTFLVEAAEPAGTCVPDERTSCLGDSRYSVTVNWRTSGGESGSGIVVREGTNDSGMFRFFDEENWEVLIKVLDGCSVNGRVWVFGAATTDLGYAVRVTDTVTGEVREYGNEPGTPAPAVTDVAAFGTCAGGSASANRAGALRVGGAGAREIGKAVAFDSDGETDGGCAGGGAALCLQDGRYEVTVAVTANGETAPARVARPRTDDSGLFWFFAPDNWEMLLKVLDGCGVNGHHWVFAATATDVGFELTVRDTTMPEGEPGSMKVYTKPPGEPAPAITDVGAFPNACAAP